MKIGVLGTGMVGQAHAARLTEQGHSVVMGTRDVSRTKGRTKTGPRGGIPFNEWLNDHPEIKLETFHEAAMHGELVIDAINGAAAVETLRSVSTGLNGKVLMDISNPLDYSRGMPPSLRVVNTDSLGEQIQRALPEVKVVKTLNTIAAPLQTDPRQLANGEHSAFICGNDASAKAQVIELMRSAYGWSDFIDLGPIGGARGMEMYLILWSQIYGALKTPIFNVQVIKGK